MKKILLIIPILFFFAWCWEQIEKNKYEWLSDIDTCESLVQELIHNERAKITDIKVDDQDEFNWLLNSNLELPISMILFKVQVWSDYVDWYCWKDESWEMWKSTNNIYMVTVWDKTKNYTD